ncbi:HupE/UreJ family protein [Alteromonas oceani]|uniref:HupE/UreJ family protein n=1 Tax=Alteromonas oceani TaxID=2071609 RepID=A0ABV7K885_9ALTE|nr:HupE/UreJ family protein [Alteromonas oceani]
MVILSKLLLAALLLLPSVAFGHGVDESTQSFLQQNEGLQFFPFMYIGAKHMFTGYDHLLFLFGVLFFLYRGREVLLYISMFTLGHSITLLTGVLADIQVNAYIIDAIIGFSVLYKGFDNLGGFKRFFGRQPDTRAAVLIFGLFHGFGLATKLQVFELSGDSLWLNLLAFNLGVEIGQIMALLLMLIIINAWRNSASFVKFSTITNSFLMSAGMMLIGYQLTGYFIG